jgi:hypothetical protein
MMSWTISPSPSDARGGLWEWKAAVAERLHRFGLTIQERPAQATPTQDGIPWVGFVVYANYQRLEHRNAVNFTRRLRHDLPTLRDHALM